MVLAERRIAAVVHGARDGYTERQDTRESRIRSAYDERRV